MKEQIKEINDKTYYKEGDDWFGLDKNENPYKVTGKPLLKKLNSDTIEGLGDVVSVITKTLGIEECDKCNKRRLKLNNFFPWMRKDIRELTSDELQLMERINATHTIQNNDVNALFQLYRELFDTNTKRCNCPGLIKRIIGRINNVIAAE